MMIIKLSDLIRDYENNYETGGYGMFLCNHVVNLIINNRPRWPRYSVDGLLVTSQFREQWHEKVHGIKFNPDEGYRIIIEDWNDDTPYSKLSFIGEFEIDAEYHTSIAGYQYRKWLLGSVLRDKGDIEFEIEG
jgi:hypothetical protein